MSRQHVIQGRPGAAWAVAAFGLCVLAFAGPAAAQKNNGNPAAFPEEIWQTQYDLRMELLAKADEEFAKLDDDMRGFLQSKRQLTDTFKKQHQEAKMARALAMRDVEGFLRRSQLKRRPVLADMYVQRSGAARTPLERVAYLDQAELVLREAIEFFNNQLKSMSARLKDLKDKLDAKNDALAAGEYARLSQTAFETRILLIRARRAFADLLINQVIYPALDEYEIYNRQTPTIKATVTAIGEAVAALRKARDEMDDLSADAKTAEQRLLKDARLDGFDQGMKISLAWSSYYRAWLSPRDPKDADRKRDLEFASETFQEYMTRKDVPDGVKAQAELGYALSAREKGEMDGAINGLAKIIAVPDLSDNKLQAIWELARTYGQLRRFEDGVRKTKELSDLAEPVKKHNAQSAADADAGKPAKPQIGTLYINIAPAMRLNLLHAWKSEKTIPGADKAAADFQSECERLRKIHPAWAMLVDSFVKIDQEKIFHDINAPKPEELKAAPLADRLMLANRFVEAGEGDKAMLYFDSIIKDPVFAKEPPAKRGEILFQVGALYYQKFEAEQKATATGMQPPPENIIAALKLFQRVVTEAPESEKAKIIENQKIVNGLLGTVERTFGREEAKKLLGGGEVKIAALRSVITKSPGDPKIDAYRLALVAELDELAGTKSGAERAKLVDEMIQQLQAIKPGTVNGVKAQVQAAYLRFDAFDAEEKVLGPRMQAPKIRDAVEALRKGADAALNSWKALNPQPELKQIQTWREIAADYVVTAADLLCRPQLLKDNGAKQAVDLVNTYDKEFAGGDMGKDWDSEEYRVRRLVLKITYFQDTGNTEEAKKLLTEFLASTSNPDRYLKRLFNQTRRKIEAKELEARTATSSAVRTKAEDEAGKLALQLIALGDQMLGRMSAADKSGPRGQEIRDLIIEMQVKSGDEALVKKAIETTEELIKRFPQNSGLYHVLKCECLTKVALRAGDDTEKWRIAGLEWLKLTKDDKIRTNPEYIDFFWQAWWNSLAVRLEQSRIAGTGVKIQEIKDARTNLRGNFGEPTDKWKPYFAELDQAILDNASAYRKQ